ncbi:MAG: hypothetical protein BECKG1743D_GA0114223_101944 [Candidatus Kentron sp. G]|nr:MAG: hypothetical protein BECKG1743F_GA0114225_104662 [Candidatus Kentron sp. G]VFN00430.1 MAG: hypothetical protein BECKG1743D_GA0114223_101944 [Candidatus Kentron sp. G]VFN01355.1 MAG: hypothetical protein BECKG1743E_GA0114224_104023 [Candidatus Kentron sp. G]
MFRLASRIVGFVDNFPILAKCFVKSLWITKLPRAVQDFAISVTLLLGLLFVSPISGNATPLNEPSVCMVTKRGGDISLTTENGTHPLRNFITLRNGDRLLLKQGSELKLVYFGTSEIPGRMETWTGPVELIIDEKETRSNGKQAAETRTSLPIAPGSDRYVIATEDRPIMRLVPRTIAGENAMAEPFDNESRLQRQTVAQIRATECYPFSGAMNEFAPGIFDGWRKKPLEENPQHNCLVAQLLSGFKELLPRITNALPNNR